MIVLTIIGVVLAALFVYIFIISINEFTLKRFNYEFFSWGNYVATGFGYGFLIFGFNWYERVYISGVGDLLNGQILLLLGLLIILIVIYINIKNTTLFLGLLLSFIQLLIYVVLVAMGLIVLFFIMAFFAQARPVYKI